MERTPEEEIKQLEDLHGRLKANGKDEAAYWIGKLIEKKVYPQLWEDLYQRKEPKK